MAMTAAGGVSDDGTRHWCVEAAMLRDSSSSPVKASQTVVLLKPVW